jgi:thiosulfate/3-mercaptopyruvate sulfurtransferase
VDYLVAPDDLAASLRMPGLVVLDASFYLPNEGKNAKSLFAASHIPGALFFDIDAIADQATELPHMLPAPPDFARMVGQLGITNNSRIVVYDRRGIFSSARVWWMFRVFGHDAIAVLDGGLPGWVQAGGTLESGAGTALEQGVFVPAYRPQMVRDIDDMKANLIDPSAIVLDARPAGRFSGAVPEPRPGLKSGHIPGAKSLPITEILDNGRLLSAERLRQRFAQAGVDGTLPVVTSCGSGVTAAVLTFGMVWAEWGGRDDTPVEL